MMYYLLLTVIWPMLSMGRVVYTVSFEGGSTPVFSSKGTQLQRAFFNPAWIEQSGDKRVSAGLLARYEDCTAQADACWAYCEPLAAAGNTDYYAFWPENEPTAATFGVRQDLAYKPGADSISGNNRQVATDVSVVHDSTVMDQYFLFYGCIAAIDSVDYYGVCLDTCSNPTAGIGSCHPDKPPIVNTNSSFGIPRVSVMRGAPFHSNVMLLSSPGGISVTTSAAFKQGWAPVIEVPENILLAPRPTFSWEVDVFPGANPQRIRSTGDILILYNGAGPASDTTHAAWAIANMTENTLEIVDRCIQPLIQPLEPFVTGADGYPCLRPNTTWLSAAFERSDHSHQWRIFYAAAGVNIGGGDVTVSVRWEDAEVGERPVFSGPFSVVVGLQLTTANRTISSMIYGAVVSLLGSDCNATELKRAPTSEGGMSYLVFALADEWAYDILVVAVHSPKGDLLMGTAGHYINSSFGVRWLQNYTEPVSEENGNNNGQVIGLAVGVPIGFAIILAAVAIVIVLCDSIPVSIRK